MFLSDHTERMQVKRAVAPPEPEPTLTEKLKALSASGVPILLIHGKQDMLVCTFS